ncbi:MAG: TRAP transporter small permease [Candidatus Atribacteria bacterium]|nr:TRAP transporter small permease [Candidatus Atribacteria bacterium]
MIQKNKKFENLCNKLDLISGFLLAVLTVVVLIEVGGRYFFKHPFTLTFDISLLLFPYMIMFAMVSVTFNNEHLGLDYFRNKLRGPLKRISMIIIKILTILFIFFMFLSSISLSVSVFYNKVGTWKIPQFLYYLPLILSFGVILYMILIGNLNSIINSIKGKE